MALLCVVSVAKFVGQQLPEIFTGSNQYTCVIYAADIPEDGLTKAWAANSAGVIS